MDSHDQRPAQFATNTSLNNPPLNRDELPVRAWNYEAERAQKEAEVITKKSIEPLPEAFAKRDKIRNSMEEIAQSTTNVGHTSPNQHIQTTNTNMVNQDNRAMNYDDIPLPVHANYNKFPQPSDFNPMSPSMNHNGPRINNIPAPQLHTPVLQPVNPPSVPPNLKRVPSEKSIDTSSAYSYNQSNRNFNGTAPNFPNSDTAPRAKPVASFAVRQAQPLEFEEVYTTTAQPTAYVPPPTNVDIGVRKRMPSENSQHLQGKENINQKRLQSEYNQQQSYRSSNYISNEAQSYGVKNPQMHTMTPQFMNASLPQEFEVVSNPGIPSHKYPQQISKAGMDSYSTNTPANPTTTDTMDSSKSFRSKDRLKHLLNDVEVKALHSPKVGHRPPPQHRISRMPETHDYRSSGIPNNNNYTPNKPIENEPLHKNFATTSSDQNVPDMNNNMNNFSDSNITLQDAEFNTNTPVPPPRVRSKKSRSRNRSDTLGSTPSQHPNESNNNTLVNSRSQPTRNNPEQNEKIGYNTDPTENQVQFAYQNTGFSVSKQSMQMNNSSSSTIPASIDAAGQISTGQFGEPAESKFGSESRKKRSSRKIEIDGDLVEFPPAYRFPKVDGSISGSEIEEEEKISSHTSPATNTVPNGATTWDDSDLEDEEDAWDKLAKAAKSETSVDTSKHSSPLVNEKAGDVAKIDIRPPIMTMEVYNTSESYINANMMPEKKNVEVKTGFVQARLQQAQTLPIEYVPNPSQQTDQVGMQRSQTAPQIQHNRNRSEVKDHDGPGSNNQQGPRVLARKSSIGFKNSDMYQKVSTTQSSQNSHSRFNSSSSDARSLGSQAYSNNVPVQNYLPQQPPARLESQQPNPYNTPAHRNQDPRYQNYPPATTNNGFPPPQNQGYSPPQQQPYVQQHSRFDGQSTTNNQYNQPHSAPQPDQQKRYNTQGDGYPPQQEPSPWAGQQDIYNFQPENGQQRYPPTQAPPMMGPPNQKQMNSGTVKRLQFESQPEIINPNPWQQKSSGSEKRNSAYEEDKGCKCVIL
ncbi:hypothetical protein HK098_005986 [Nowakowskiella sp. JEL0407]|nr:hypothetical protein HK098_005986 [Nowakowskiella sp. JEL0407]